MGSDPNLSLGERLDDRVSKQLLSQPLRKGDPLIGDSFIFSPKKKEVKKTSQGLCDISQKRLKRKN
jgi:hypothetical protein